MASDRDSKRILKELTECKLRPPSGMKIHLPTDSDMHRWHVVLSIPRDEPGTPYRGGTFGLVILLPVEYPFKAPVVTFHTRIYHPNVTNDASGNICLALLKAENWKPTTKLYSVLEAVRGLLFEPQPDDPLEVGIAQEFRTERRKFNSTVEEYVRKWAAKEDPFNGRG